ncbi:MAG TPA: glycosyltransferase family A protein [Bryobacteraceae bacterium]|nr:glycosyltransferase family A protein [Bryobacteraceae bacterium]
MIPVSVVIPLYNGARWIADAIASVTAQTYPHELLEITVVDDGSGDDGAAVAAAALKGSDIASVVLRTGNGGPSRARNLGWQRSRGEWIQFLDADDVIAPEKIRLHAAAAEKMPRDVAVLYSDWKATRLVEGQWIPSGAIHTPSLGEDTIASLVQSDQFLSNASCLFRRSWLAAVGGFDERHWLIEDVDLLLRIAMAGGQFRRIETSEPLFNARQHDNTSLSRRDPAAFHEGCVRNAAMVEEYWRSRGEMTESRARLVAKIYHQGARYFAAHNRRRFEELAGRIESLTPGFVPESPALLRKVSRVVGFRRAELLSVQYRRAKGMAKAKSV